MCALLADVRYGYTDSNAGIDIALWLVFSLSALPSFVAEGTLKCAVCVSIAFEETSFVSLMAQFEMRARVMAGLLQCVCAFDIASRVRLPRSHPACSLAWRFDKLRHRCVASGKEGTFGRSWRVAYTDLLLAVPGIRNVIGRTPTTSCALLLNARAL